MCPDVSLRGGGGLCNLTAIGKSQGLCSLSHPPRLPWTQLSQGLQDPLADSPLPWLSQTSETPLMRLPFGFGLSVSLSSLSTRIPHPCHGDPSRKLLHWTPRYFWNLSIPHWGQRWLGKVEPQGLPLPDSAGPSGESSVRRLSVYSLGFSLLLPLFSRLQKRASSLLGSPRLI